MPSQFTRRKFLAAGTVAAITGKVLAGKPDSTSGLQVLGSAAEAMVPDTLELADRAALAINALTRIADPNNNYESFQCCHLDHQPPYMTHRWAGPCLQKPVHALPMMRVMSGSTQNADVDDKMLDALLRDIESDGLWWLKVEGRPWRTDTFKVDQSWPVAHARLMVALLDRYDNDHDDKWLKIVDRMASGMADIALRKDDRAWYRTAYTRSGWKEHPDSFSNTQENSRTIEEPDEENFYNIGLPLRAFSRWYAISGDKKALEMADRLARFLMKRSMWGNGEGPTMVDGPEHAHWKDHFHTSTMGMIGLLDYAIITHNTPLMRFVADYYEYTRQFGISRMGFFPAVIGPLDKVRERNEPQAESGAQVSEGCATADMLWIAATLSEADIGDYWDDVDQYARNHLVEHQILRRDLIEEILAVAPEHTYDPEIESIDDVVERNIGSFVSGSDPTWLYAWWTMCCVGNCSMALYKAWDSIVRSSDGMPQVRLLLNRTSPWVDVESHLPYEGKVVLRNKSAREMAVRLPRWVDKREVRCRVGANAVSPVWLHNNAIVKGLKGKDVVSIEFPMVETTEKHTELTYGIQYNCQFKGNTLVDISPRSERPAWAKMGDDAGALFPVVKGYPIYLRDHFKQTKAPMKKRPRRNNDLT